LKLEALGTMTVSCPVTSEPGGAVVVAVIVVVVVVVVDVVVVVLVVVDVVVVVVAVAFVVGASVRGHAPSCWLPAKPLGM